MVLYGLVLLSLVEAMQEADPGVLQPWYADNVAMRGPSRRNAKLLRALMGKAPFVNTFWSRRRVGTSVETGGKRKGCKKILMPRG